jgi:hypothetical protein
MLKRGLAFQVPLHRPLILLRVYLDGPNTVCATCHIVYVSVDEEALRNSVTVQLPNLNQDAFLEFNLFHRFLSTFSSLDESWVPEDIRVFGVETGRNIAGQQMLNVSFFVTKDEETIR